MDTTTPFGLILKVGASGGSIKLHGRRMEGGGWEFRVDTSDMTPELVDEEAINISSPVVRCWEEALALLDRYPWPRLYPIQVDPAFTDRVLSAVRERIGEPTERTVNRLKQWEALCETGSRG